VALALLEFAPDVVSRLLAGDSAHVALQLLDAAGSSSTKQLAGGLGGQVGHAGWLCCRS